MQLNGIILKGIGGFYYVETAEGVFECKAKGRFRREKISPIAGDKVSITVNSNAENTIDEIDERKNFLLRPPVANIDNLLLVDIYNRAKKLHIEADVRRVVMILEMPQEKDRRHHRLRFRYRLLLLLRVR